MNLLEEDSFGGETSKNLLVVVGEERSFGEESIGVESWKRLLDVEDVSLDGDENGGDSWLVVDDEDKEGVSWK